MASRPSQLFKDETTLKRPACGWNGLPDLDVVLLAAFDYFLRPFDDHVDTKSMRVLPTQHNSVAHQAKICLRSAFVFWLTLVDSAFCSGMCLSLRPFQKNMFQAATCRSTPLVAMYTCIAKMIEDGFYHLAFSKIILTAQ